MLFKSLVLSILMIGAATADSIDDTVAAALNGLTVVQSADPYSKTIQRVYIGYDENGQPVTGVALRKIKSFKTITGVVIVDKTADGYILREAIFPDIAKIKNAKDRKQVLTVLKQFKNVPFNPRAEQSAVDGLSGATRYGIKTSGYLNYLARHTALALENPPDWAKPK